MSDAPHDAKSLIAWFTATEIVRHDGSRSPRSPYMTREEAELLAAQIGQPDNYFGGRYVWTAERIWSIALDRGIFMNDRFGWIDRDGRFWGCGHAAHELLLHFLGVDIGEVEHGGWIRISMSGPQTIFTPSEGQIKALIARGQEGIAKRFINEGIEPTRANVRAARVGLAALSSAGETGT